jgi:uncharacterized protein (TIGR02453 family)
VAFDGWQAEAIEFYEGLTADNSRSYWQAHKTDYEELVRRPMLELLTELEPEFGEGKIFRPYRDIRFSKDKAPYKTAIGATLAGGGYVQFSAEGLSAGLGSYHLAPDQLDRYRRAVADESSGAKLAEIVATVRRAGLEVTAHDVLKTSPKGYPKDHPRVDLLRYKGLITWTHWPAGEWLGTSEAKERVIGFLRTSAPVNDWLAAYVGDSELPPAR